LLISGVALAVLCLGPTLLDASPPRPVLVVPSQPLALDVAIRLPGRVGLPKVCAWQLVEVGRADAAVPVQLVTPPAADGSAGEKNSLLLATIPPWAGASAPRHFRLEPAKTTAAGAQREKGFHFKEVDDKSLALWDGKQPVLVYNHGTIVGQNVPESDHRRSRACYVHPVWGLNGEVLTDDFPRDHYHHHGIFWAWLHVRIDGREYDLWTCSNIRQKFVRWVCREAGPAAAVLAVENGWFVGDRKVMIERVWLRAYKPADGSRAIDITLVLIPVDRPVTLSGAEGKSYGGLTVRMAVREAKDVVITVPGGRAADDLKDSPLPWADLTTQFPGAPSPSGAAVFVSPGHPGYPPAWLTRHYGVLCIGYPGVTPKTFEPDKPLRLDYRFWIHKTAVDPARLNQAYGSYTSAETRVRWQP
jgi:hypothetical protein